MRPKQVAVALDQMANTLLGGWADETLSAKAFRLCQQKKSWSMVRRAIDALFFWEKSHCAASYAAEFERRHLPPEYRRQR